MDLPSIEPEPERYQGRPLLLILENYVLDCIGHLPADKQSTIAALVSKAFGASDNWKATIRATLKFEESIDSSIQMMWDKNQSITKNNGDELHPIQFAKMCVDTNFAHLIE